jgi:hypothetical protein
VERAGDDCHVLVVGVGVGRDGVALNDRTLLGPRPVPDGQHAPESRSHEENALHCVLPCRSIAPERAPTREGQGRADCAASPCRASSWTLVHCGRPNPANRSLERVS